MKILIVDDDFMLLEQLQSALQGQNYATVAARNGRKALDTVGRQV